MNQEMLAREKRQQERQMVVTRLNDPKEGYILNAELFGWGRTPPYNDLRVKAGLAMETPEQLATMRRQIGVRVDRYIRP